MDIVSLSTRVAAERFNSQSSIQIARKAVDPQKQQGQNGINAAPAVGYGKGTMVDCYA